MKILNGLTLAMIIGASSIAISASQAEAAKMSQVHMGHVTKSWKDTPGKKGFLPTALAEAKIAAQHAGFAAKKTGDLGWMKTHTGHVMNAVDPSTVKKGPGKGYGVLKAAKGAAKHIGLAAKSKDASKNVKTHAVHVAASSNNTIARAMKIMSLGKKIMAAKSAAKAAPMVKQMAVLAARLTKGHDANGDGKITWQKGEGGLNAVKKHMALMAKGEGM